MLPASIRVLQERQPKSQRHDVHFRVINRLSPMNQPGLQDQLFERILERYPRKSDAVEALCELLNTTKDPVYRRLRGDTLLVPEELTLLARHYHISLDGLIFNRDDNVVCSFNAFSHQVKNFEDYLGGFCSRL